ncbi:MAG: hypothetical protein KKC54_04680, partial [Nanoarchaeota archaeon]|nr:hypothetical protein [Nanoarchaeota archaeon]
RVRGKQATGRSSVKMFSRHKWTAFEGILLTAGFAQLGKIIYFPVLIAIVSVNPRLFSCGNMIKRAR